MTPRAKVMQSIQVKFIESKKGNHNAPALILYEYNINKHKGREGEVRVLMNTLNSSSKLLSFLKTNIRFIKAYQYMIDNFCHISD